MTRTKQPGTPTENATDPRRRETKTERVTQLLSRKTGADLATLCTATGWQPHSVRAVLSGLRKAGYTVDRQPSRTETGGSVYRITGRTEAPT